ncbi:PREDICTED: adenylyl cyclase-associated protein 1-like [Priapulus caudatus]|uniref:Adenylyl cyclase-associated protein 1-like n=1 Tax=Priapulus caudatus TaxID=37621 RepID=A0ABM1DQ66_PRICU|nr:PREDICTED: adenylyl cyclase-associated protein 1-like [Priapulus caudatus]
MKLLTPTSKKIQEVQQLREANRGKEHFNHLSGVGESIPALGWVTITPTPSPYVKEMVNAGQFFTNRVVKDYKEKDAEHVTWTRAWMLALGELQAYVKQHYTTGVTWNPKGVDAAAAGEKPTIAPKPGAGAPSPPLPPPASGAPPPPPPPSKPLWQDSPAPDASDSAKSALFADLNKGLGITAGLKKVSPDMQTHKNTELRAGPTPYKPGPTPYKAGRSTEAAKPAVAAPIKPPVFELEGKKWMIENQKDNSNLVVDKTELKQVVYVYNCTNCTVQVKGKVNSITLDKCKKVGLVFENALSSAEVVNCQRTQLQVTGKVPTIVIDKTDGVQIYLSKESMDVEIVSAKSSEMNISIPQDDGEYNEYAIPEQYKTIWNGKQLVTGTAEQTG